MDGKKGAITMTIVCIILFVFASFFAVVSVRLFIDNREWSDLASEIQRENEALRENNAVLCGEKLQLAKEIDGVTTALSAARAQLADALGELENVEAERNELIDKVIAASLKSVSSSLLPAGRTNTFRCEDYKLFAKNSQQAALQAECFTHSEYGIRFYLKDGIIYYCAAMATAYGTEIGQAYSVTLANGAEFCVIVADFKHPIDNPRTDDYGDPDTNYDSEPCTNVIEFVVDMDIIPETVRLSGTMSALEQFGGLYGDGGDIVSIEKLERIWKL